MQNEIQKKFKAKQSQAEKQKSKLAKREALRKQYTCKKAVYENAQILDPQGQLLCHTEIKKAKWYLNKGLANCIKEANGELVVQLTFEPNRKDAFNSPDDQFYC